MKIQHTITAPKDTFITEMDKVAKVHGFSSADCSQKHVDIARKLFVVTYEKDTFSNADANAKAKGGIKP